MKVHLIAATHGIFYNTAQEYPEIKEWFEDLHDDSSWVSSSELLAEFAGRLCYESWNRPNPETATNAAYVANIIKQQHFSVLEHNVFTFFATGVSRSLTHELIRHRHLSFSELSQRYVGPEGKGVVVPPLLQADEDYVAATEILGAEMVDGVIASEYGHDVVTGHYKDVYEKLQPEYGKKAARGAARYILPGGWETKIVVSGNARTWRDVISKRKTDAADIEIRLFATEVLKQLKAEAPNLFQDM